MFAWLAANAATIIISAVLLVIVGLILRGMARGRIKTCGDCGSCGGACASDDAQSPCGACQFSGQCHKS